MKTTKIYTFSKQVDYIYRNVISHLVVAVSLTTKVCLTARPITI